MANNHEQRDRKRRKRDRRYKVVVQGKGYVQVCVAAIKKAAAR